MNLIMATVRYTFTILLAGWLAYHRKVSLGVITVSAKRESQ